MAGLNGSFAVQDHQRLRGNPSEGAVVPKTSYLWEVTATSDSSHGTRFPIALAVLRLSAEVDNDNNEQHDQVDHRKREHQRFGPRPAP